MPTSTDIKLLDAQEYIHDLVITISHAKKCVYIMSLIFTDDELTHPIIEALIAAAGRGVKVVVTADSFTYSELGGVFSPFKHRSQRSKIATATADRLQAAGVTFTWLGAIYKWNPFKGITHTKWSVVDDTCYAFGGVNLYILGIRSVDYMFRFDDPTTASQFINEQEALVRSSPSNVYPGFSATNRFGTFYIDSGIQHDSPIYDRALALAAQATHILYVSQYCPSGPLTHDLHRATSEVYFNQARNTSFPTNIFLAFEAFWAKMESRYTKTQYLHAKFIIFTMKNGEKVALTGSHNFSHRGVAFGTREIALETRNPIIISELEAFRKTHVY